MHTRPHVIALSLALVAGGLLTTGPAEAKTRGLYHWELGGHVVGMGLGAKHEVEPEGYGGVGVQARYRLRRRWGLELSGSVLHGELADGTKRDLALISGALTYHLFPDSRFQVYGLAGLGVVPARWYRPDGETIGASTAPLAQAGGGAMLDLSPLRLFADLRGVAIFRQHPKGHGRGPQCEGRGKDGCGGDVIGGTALHVGAALVW